MPAAKLSVLLFLIAATAMEVGGDAIVRLAIGHAAWPIRLVLFVAGGLLLFGYGFTLNSAPVSFEKVVGIYIATLFVMWQLIGFVLFRHLPTPPILIGGALIVVGGLIVTFWSSVQ